MSKKLKPSQNWKLLPQSRAAFRNTVWNIYVSRQTNLNNSAVKIWHIRDIVHAQCTV